MLTNSYVTKIIFLCVAVMVLTQCAKNTDAPRQTRATTPFMLTTDTYLALADKEAGGEKQTLLLQAAGRSLYDGQWHKAASILAQTQHLSPIQQDEKNIFLAQIDIKRHHLADAIVTLSAIRQVTGLSPYFQLTYHELLARAYQATGQITYAINERLKLDHLLTNKYDEQKNRQQLWLMLATLPIAELHTLAIEAKEGSAIQGWVQLALIARETANKTAPLLVRVKAWQQRYPGHSANSVLSISKVNTILHSEEKSKKMALLVPLSGALAGPGSAVRDGFMAAMHQQDVDSSVSIQLYDTAATNVVSLYQKAVADGANYIVGPLTKNDVATITALHHPVPTVVLNDTATFSSNIYHFSLSPMNEAKQIASAASNDGLARALVIAPTGAWGSDIAMAFATRWQEHGGKVIETFVYDDKTDLNQAIRTFLHVSQHDAQEKQLKSMADQSLPSMPKRRDDFDMIFLLAYPSKARQIMPLLKYYFLGNIPVYATSTVYTGSLNPMRDRDLDGIIFCDIPGLFNNQLSQKNWPEQFNSYSRLYALGMDSYAIVNQLNQLLLFSAIGTNNQDDALYLNHAQNITRKLAWGTFRGGVARRINVRV